MREQLSFKAGTLLKDPEMQAGVEFWGWSCPLQCCPWFPARMPKSWTCLRGTSWRSSWRGRTAGGQWNEMGSGALSPALTWRSSKDGQQIHLSLPCPWGQQSPHPLPSPPPDPRAAGCLVLMCWNKVSSSLLYGPFSATHLVPRELRGVSPWGPPGSVPEDRRLGRGGFLGLRVSGKQGPHGAEKLRGGVRASTRRK